MTNVLAFKMNYKGADCAFLVADSQSMSLTEKANTQKLVRRGDNFIASAGSGYIGQAVKIALLDDNLDVFPAKLAERVLYHSEKVLSHPELDRYEQSRELHEDTVFTVVGRNNDSVEIYEVPLGGKGVGKKGIYSQSFSNIGSGSIKISSALDRAYKSGVGGGSPTDLVEALLTSYVMGQVADEDPGVNDKLQYAFITPESVRLLIHPSIQATSIRDYLNYLKEFSGIDVKQSKRFGDDVSEKQSALNRTIAAFYNGLEIELGRLNRADINMNSVHSGLKQGRSTMAEYKKAISHRKEKKVKVKEMFEAFLKGDLENLVEATRGFYRGQEAYLEQALELKR